MWQTAHKVETRGIRRDVFFSLSEYNHLGKIDFTKPRKFKVYTTWKVGKLELTREFTPAHTLGIPRKGNPPLETKERTTWTFEIKWGDTDHD